MQNGSNLGEANSAESTCLSLSLFIVWSHYIDCIILEISNSNQRTDWNDPFGMADCVSVSVSEWMCACMYVWSSVHHHVCHQQHHHHHHHHQWDTWKLSPFDSISMLSPRQFRQFTNVDRPVGPDRTKMTGYAIEDGHVTLWDSQLEPYQWIGRQWWWRISLTVEYIAMSVLDVNTHENSGTMGNLSHGKNTQTKFKKRNWFVSNLVLLTPPFWFAFVLNWTTVYPWTKWVYLYVLEAQSNDC